jgi:uncharacterized protein (TIGR03437 family)
VGISVNPTGLSVGRYQALVQVSADDTVNSPQFVSVLLNVVAPTADPGPAVTPTTLVFTARQNGTAAGSQSIRMYNLGAAPLLFNVFGGTVDGGNWLVYKAPTPPLNPGQPLDMIVQTDPTGLTPGIHRGVITVLFETGAIRNVAVNLFVAASTRGGASASLKRHNEAAACVPDTTVQPVISMLGTGTRLPAAVPAVIDTLVMDQSGCPLTTGNVQVRVIDPGEAAPVSLSSLGDGVWEGVYQPQTPGTSTVVAIAADANLMVSGMSDPVVAQIDPPLDGLLAVGNVVSTASLLSGPVAPGSVISILGSNLGPRASLKQNLPWDTNWGEVSVRLGGVLLPISFVSQNQLDTVVPFGVQPGTVPQLVIAYQDTLSLLPLPVAVTDAQPAVYTENLVGTGLAQISNASGPVNRTHSGDQITIRCSGLGEVDPPINVGVPVPTSPQYAVKQPVSVNIGGSIAPFVSAALAPGTSGDYNVVVLVPSLDPGTYNLTVTAGSSTSTPVQIMVQ